MRSRATRRGAQRLPAASAPLTRTGGRRAPAPGPEADRKWPIAALPVQRRA